MTIQLNYYCFFYYLLSDFKMEVSSDISKCELCGKSFGRQIRLSEHKTKHSCVKSYSCSDCNKAFVNISALKDHLKNHVVDKPFSCEVCNKSFSKQTYLSMHKKNHQQTERNVSNIESKPFGDSMDSRAVLQNTTEELTDNMDNLTDDDVLALAVDFML